MNRKPQPGEQLFRHGFSFLISAALGFAVAATLLGCGRPPFTGWGF